MGNGMDKVLEGLYIGSIRDATDRKQLDTNKITHILSVYNKPRPMISDRVYLCITAQDNAEQELSRHFSECTDFIHQARVNGGHVLVHCLAGVSRSVTLVIAYVMAVTGYTWRECYNIVHAAHRASSPNFGFQRQLLRFQYEQLSEERERVKKKWPPSPHDDSEMCKKWLAVHDKWVQGGDKAVFESTVYPLSYNSFTDPANSLNVVATPNTTPVNQDSVHRAAYEDKVSTTDTSDGRKGSPGIESTMLHSIQVRKSQPTQSGQSPEVGVTSLNEFFKPSPNLKEVEETKQKYSSRMMEHCTQNNTWNNSCVSALSIDEGSDSHTTSDIPEAQSKICEESDSSDKAKLDEIFASYLG